MWLNVESAHLSAATGHSEAVEGSLKTVREWQPANRVRRRQHGMLDVVSVSLAGAIGHRPAVRGGLSAPLSRRGPTPCAVRVPGTRDAASGPYVICL